MRVAPSHILSVTKSLEAEILKLTSSDKTPTPAYRTKIRSLIQNLKSNSVLRQNLVAGQLSVARLSTMTSAEMASDERREENQRLQEQNIFNAQGAAPKNATTSEFLCLKCKQRKVSYYQMQTRSADEPMTSIPPPPFPPYHPLFERDSLGCWVIANVSFLPVRKLWKSMEVLAEFGCIVGYIYCYFAVQLTVLKSQ
jgi:DNA-directed RNA polymerase subunit M/transcription elongation factor TFIIS